MGYFRFPKYVSVAEKKAKAAKKLKQLQKKNSDIQPVIIEGNSLANTWWGKAWNSNLTKYADFSNRVGRGRSYLRHGAVLDLKIDSGTVSALVQGSLSIPYKVEISIKKITQNNWKNIKDACHGKIDSLQELLQGKFPKALAEIFTSKNQGLFPSPAEIQFSCSCPDWAYMCKHVASALFGIGSRLDENPMLFFKLRGVDGNELVKQAVKDNTNKLLEKAKNKTSRVLEDINISDLFGIDMESDSTNIKPPKIKNKKQPANSITGKIKENNQKSDKKQKNSLTKKSYKKAKSNIKDIDIILKAIQQAKKGIAIPALQKQTKIKDRQRLFNCVYQLLEKGKIKRISRGVYMKV